jgi:hypothetical protein
MTGMPKVWREDDPFPSENSDNGKRSFVCIHLPSKSIIRYWQP